MRGTTGAERNQELGTSLAGLGVAGRGEFIVKTGWGGMKQVWRAKLPWRCDHTTRNSSVTRGKRGSPVVKQENTLKIREAGSPQLI